MQRQRIVDLARYTFCLEMRLHLVSLGRSNRELVVDMPGPIRSSWKRDSVVQAGCREQLPVRFCVAPSPLGPRFQIPKLYAQDRRLDGIQPAIRADQFVVIALPTAVPPKKLDTVSKFGIVRCDQPAIA